MKHYELTCLGEANSLSEKLTFLIQGEKGILLDVSKKANLVSFSFQMEPEYLINLEKKLKSEIPASRYLILAKKTPKAAKAAKRIPFVEKPRQKVEIGEIEKKLEEILKE
jgi:hypothetical protein